ncbi:MAG: flagellar basal body rod protein FlgC [Proteobacteria bacterium]|nr:flagellar basal body rod protein FlgC [Pseudomonadota bacterium]MDA0896096.1 flagellar basal body rod protein FlgC [Pseudomonadota bacterium]MDA1244496.1 flagellar basal body rod protein FlgC [Pseudomonadota bacterium]
MSFERLMSIAGTGMNAQLIRMNTTASNLANAGVVAGTDAGAFRAKRPVFESLLNLAMSGKESFEGGVRVNEIIDDPKPVKQVFEPNNPLADENGYVFASNVNEIEELIEMMDASRAYQNNIEVISTAKQLMSRTLDVIKV